MSSDNTARKNETNFDSLQVIINKCESNKNEISKDNNKDQITQKKNNCNDNNNNNNNNKNSNNSNNSNNNNNNNNNNNTACFQRALLFAKATRS